MRQLAWRNARNMKVNKNWGGKRPNQTGRPPLPESDRRVHVNARVLPETKRRLAATGQSMGKAIDELVAGMKGK